MENLIENQNVCVGCLWIEDDKHSTKIYVDKSGAFLNSEEELKDWAYALKTPWSGTSTHYNVHPNYRFSGEWVAEKIIVVYDDVDVMIMAAGDSPQQAITNCDKFMEAVIEKYYAEDDD